MRNIFIGLLTLLSATATQAGLFVGNGYAILDNNNGGNSYYDISNQGNDGSTPSYVGQTFTIQSGQSLTLGGQVQTYPGFAQSGAASSAALNYLVVGTSVSGSFNLPFLQNVGNNDQWQQVASSSGVNLDQSLAIGNYTLELWFGAVANDGSGTFFDNNGGANYSATLSVVPEPIYPALGIFVALLGFARFGGPLWQKLQPAQVA